MVSANINFFHFRDEGITKKLKETWKQWFTKIEKHQKDSYDN